MKYHFKVNGPFRLEGENNLFKSSLAELNGIYLWAIKVDGHFLINYIGETGLSFKQRMKEHLIQIMGGNYRIPDPKDLRHGKETILWNGLWRKGERDNIAEFILKYEFLAPVIKEYIQMIEVFLIPMKVETRKRRLIEGNMASHLRSQPHSKSCLLPSDIRYITNKKSDEDPFTVTFLSEIELLGLPELISIG